MLEDRALTVPSTLGSPLIKPPCLCASSVPKGWLARSRGEAPGCGGPAQSSMGEPPVSHQHWDHLQGQLTSSVCCFPKQQTPLGTEPGPRVGPTVPSCSGTAAGSHPGSKFLQRWSQLAIAWRVRTKPAWTSKPHLSHCQRWRVPGTDHIPSSTLSTIRHQQQLDFPGSSRLWGPAAGTAGVTLRLGSVSCRARADGAAEGCALGDRWLWLP